MNKVLNLTYASSLTDLCERNSSFDSAKLRIAYHGKNRNGSHISKKAFEKSLPTIYNCPIVCHYDRETDTIGGHDIELVRDGEGELKIVNLTIPVGCIPESSNVYWETVVEDDGEEHEYLCADALIWKRQEAYQKIKSDGVTAQSMEITVKDGESDGDVFYIKEFEFTAFALIGVTPCFEDASLEFSKQNFKLQLSQMMADLKDSFSQVDTSNEVDICEVDLTEGGEKVLNEKLELAAKYEINVEELDFSIDDFNLEELEEKFKAMKEETPSEEEPNAAEEGEEFALESNLRDELVRVLETETIRTDWGEYPRYCFVDYDKEQNVVYCWDANDWLLYGFDYVANGDSIVIDYACKKRKKFEIVDFDEGEQASPFGQVFAMMEEKIAANADIEEKFNNASEKVESMEKELVELRTYKENVEAEAEKSKKDAIFAKFSMLNGVEEFEALKSDCESVAAEDLEEKCFAILGRNNIAKFSAEHTKTPIIKVEKNETSDNDPYGGIFTKYGVASKD